MKFEDYQTLIDNTEKCGNSDTMERFEVRTLEDNHRKRVGFNSDGYVKKYKYFVVDNRDAALIHESRWDIPNDHNSDGVRDYCFGIVRGLKMNSKS